MGKWALKKTIPTLCCHTLDRVSPEGHGFYISSSRLSCVSQNHFNLHPLLHLLQIATKRQRFTHLCKPSAYMTKHG